MLIVLIVACGPEPDPCVAMCAAATEAYAACLDEADATWTDAGYDDEADFARCCETWAWEMRLLAEDDEAVDATCGARAASLGGDEPTCDAFTAIDWTTVPGT